MALLRRMPLFLRHCRSLSKARVSCHQWLKNIFLFLLVIHNIRIVCIICKSNWIEQARSLVSGGEPTVVLDEDRAFVSSPGEVSSQIKFIAFLKTNMPLNLSPNKIQVLHKNVHFLRRIWTFCTQLKVFNTKNHWKCPKMP